MGLSNTPAVKLPSGHTEAHAAATGYPEQHLWLAVLAQAAADLCDPSVRIRQDAENFFLGPDLLRVLEFAGIGASCAPVIRDKAMARWQQPGCRRQGVAYGGEIYTVAQWSRITGLKKQTIYLRLRKGWSAEQALTLPLQKVGRHGLQ